MAHQEHKIEKDKFTKIFICFMEVCGKLIQTTSKFWRFGDITDNTIHSEMEQQIGDVLCMIEIMIAAGKLDHNRIDIAKKQKNKQLQKYSTIFAAYSVENDIENKLLKLDKWYFDKLSIFHSNKDSWRQLHDNYIAYYYDLVNHGSILEWSSPADDELIQQLDEI